MSKYTITIEDEADTSATLQVTGEGSTLKDIREKIETSETSLTEAEVIFLRVMLTIQKVTQEAEATRLLAH